MYKLFLVFPFLLLFSCQDASNTEQKGTVKNYVTFSGKIINSTVDSIGILSREFSKIIAINEDGSFKDTFSLEPGTYYLSTQEKGMIVFLKNGYDLSLSVDNKAFETSAKFTGEGSKENNYLIEKANFEETLLFQDLSHLTEVQLDSAVEVILGQASDFIHKQEGIDSLLINENLEDLNRMSKPLKEHYVTAFRLLEEMPKGGAAPLFTDYENYDGTKTSLVDFKGKNVYIDVWATWCGPCKAEIPALKQLEHDYEGKNIAFVSLSIDAAQAHQNSWEIAHEKWRAMIKDKALGGTQLIAPNGGESPFIRAFKINSIPRFILLDTEGNIINANAPRPSDQALRTLLDKVI